jgi:hypothetical protein
MCFSGGVRFYEVISGKLESPEKKKSDKEQ